jgi:hypothetical protein
MPGLLEALIKSGGYTLKRLGKLKRFLPPQLADVIMVGGADGPRKGRRREITVVFLDIRAAS